MLAHFNRTRLHDTGSEPGHLKHLIISDFFHAPRVRLYTDLTADEAAALNARTPLRDVYGNPYDRATWFTGSLLYAFD